MNDSQPQPPLKSLFQSLDPEGQATEADQENLLAALQELLGDDWDEVNNQVGAIFADTQPQSIDHLSAPEILEKVSRKIEDSIDLLSQFPTPMPYDPESSEALLRQIEMRLIDASIWVGDLQKGFAEPQHNRSPLTSTPIPSSPEPASLPAPKSNRQIPWQILIAAGCLLLPFGVKFGIPQIIRSSTPLNASQSTDLYAVTEIQPQSFQVRQADGTRLQVRLLGLSAPVGQWQSETVGVLSMLIEASGSQVRLQPLEIPVQNRAPLGVIAQLPNGTSLQAILLSNGLVKINEQELSHLPKPFAAELRAAQASAQAQHKNIWGATP